MKKKKLLALGMVAAMATTAIGGTLAYFTDTDAAKNVMTTGNVNISQNETLKDGETEFKDNIPLMPMVNNIPEGEATVVDGFFNENMLNVVDKVVTVKNDAKAGAINQDAYVRTILAFETKTEYAVGTDTVLRDADTIFETYIGYIGDFEKLNRTVTVDGVEYVLAVKVYDKALAPQGETEPSLKQIFLSPNANNEVATLFGDDYTILALSQGTQVAGFETAGAEVALNTAFGDLTDKTAETYVDDATMIEWLKAAK